jgi:hypothetical protein
VRTASAPSPGSDAPVSLDDHDLRLLRAIRDDPHEWSARADFQEAPIDELRLYEMARFGYVDHVGERFLWKLTPKGRVALAYHSDDANETQSLLQLEAIRGDGAPVHARPPYVEGPAQAGGSKDAARSTNKLWPEDADEQE